MCRIPNLHSRAGRIGAVLAALTAATCVGLAPASAAPRDDATLVIKVGTLHVGDGRTIEHGVVIVTGGKISAVGAGIAIPGGAQIIDLPKASLTPGLIDANALVEPTDVVTPERPGGPSVLSMMFQPDEHSHDLNDSCWACSGQPACAFANIHDTLEPGQVCPCCGYPNLQTVVDSIDGASGVLRSVALSESSSEVVPNTRVIDSVNLRSPDFQRLARHGVTTVFVSPDSSPVIGPEGAIVRTAGPIMDRVISPTAGVKAAMGTDSFTVGADNNPPFRQFVSTRTRRPNTRMGVAWVFRKALYDTLKWKKGETPTGADTPPTDAFPVLDSIMTGKTPLRMQARMQQDILTAIRLAKEFKLNFTLLEGVEAYKCVDELKSGKIPVVYGPLSIDPTGVRQFAADSGDSRLSTVRELVDAGVTVALSAQDLREEDGLARQAMLAVRAGLTPEQALTAVTLTPAKLLGIDNEVGTIEAGKRADLVVWSGEPTEATSRPLVVLVGGHTVADAREPAGAN